MERKFRYITNRPLKNKKDEQTGRIKILVKKDSDIAEVDYICPECQHEEHVKQDWLRPFIVVCSKCNAKMRVPRLKDEIKREKNKLTKQAREAAEKAARDNL